MNNKNLINQYVDTGLRLPEIQVGKLPTWAKKTYIRKRVIATANNHSLKFYELQLLDKTSLYNYLRTIDDSSLKSLLNQCLYYEVDIIVNHYVNFMGEISNKHFTILLEYISDDKRDNFINLFLKYNISKLYRYNISDIIMNAIKPEQFIVKLFTNEHVLSVINDIVIRYLDERIGIVEFLNHFDNNTALKLSELMLNELNIRDNYNYGNSIKKNITKNLFNLKFDDSIDENFITRLIQTHKDDGVKLLIKNLSKEKIISIFKNVEYYAGVEDLGPFGVKLAVKYGSMVDPTPTFEDIFNEINKNDYYEDDKGGIIDVDYLENPLPDWAKDVGAKAGYMYNDSTMGDDQIYSLSREQLLAIVKKQIPKIFKFRK